MSTESPINWSKNLFSGLSNLFLSFDLVCFPLTKFSRALVKNQVYCSMENSNVAVGHGE